MQVMLISSSRVHQVWFREQLLDMNHWCEGTARSQWVSQRMLLAKHQRPLAPRENSKTDRAVKSRMATKERNVRYDRCRHWFQKVQIQSMGVGRETR